MTQIKNLPPIAVIGLGYVGFPLACALAKHFDVIAFDNNQNHVQKLLSSSPPFTPSSDPKCLSKAHIFIVAVPTPLIENTFTPDLNPLINACQILAPHIKHKSIVCFESTVYPGTLDEICTPQIEKYSKLSRFQDFALAYAPERISPGSQDFTLEKLPRIIAADNAESQKTIASIYGTLNNHAISIAPSIKVAEAAKLIENVQRDVNIALANELALFCDRINISALDVIEAASSKPNFLPCTPGLVGGHCIGVDPYYLIHKAQKIAFSPSLTSTARSTNNNMAPHFAHLIHARTKPQSRILILGITFKANISDTRNTKIPLLAQTLKSLGHAFDIYDPHADNPPLKTLPSLTPHSASRYDALVLAIPHKEFQHINFKNLLKKNALIADIHGFWDNNPLIKDFKYWKP